MARFAASTSFFAVASAVSATLSATREVVGLHHPLEHAVFVRLDLVLGEGNLVLDGVVFLVRLHGHRLVAEFREAALVECDVLLDVPPRRLVGGNQFLRGRYTLSGVVESAVERLHARRFIGKLAFGVVNGGVNLLEGDEPFKVCMHVESPVASKVPHRGVAQTQKKPRRLCTGACPSTPLGTPRATSSGWLAAMRSPAVRDGDERDEQFWKDASRTSLTPDSSSE